MLKLPDELCYGCTACVNACPKNCLTMVENDEGFLIPVLTDESLCVDCNICNQVCPALNLTPEKITPQKSYIVQNKDPEILAQSTSGGAFTAIADYILTEGGIVYGAAYDENFKVVHIGVENKEDVWKFRGSKYVQSYLGNTFKEIKQHLCNNKKVCFSGTPCQIEGLVAFLKKDYENLFLVDVVCHGIASPLIWEKYLELQNGNLPDNIYFRWKHYGYKYSTMSFFKNGKETYYGGVESDPMLRAYFSNNCDRKTCYDCKFKKRYRVSDITIWDCFQPQYFDKNFDDDKGATSVLIHSKKGENLFSSLLEKDLLKHLEVDPDDIVFGNNELVNSVSCGTFRDSLLSDSNYMPAKDLFAKYFPNSLKIKIKKNLRVFLLKLGVYRKIKYLLFLIRRKRAD